MKRRALPVRVVDTLIVICVVALTAVGFVMRGSIASWWSERSEPAVVDLLSVEEASKLAEQGSMVGLEHLVRHFGNDEALAAACDGAQYGALVSTALDLAFHSRVRLHRAMRRGQDDAVLATLTALCGDSDPDVRLAAMTCVSYRARIRTVKEAAAVADTVHVLLARVENGDVTERCVAAEALTHLPCDEAATRRLVWALLKAEANTNVCSRLVGPSSRRVNLRAVLAEAIEDGAPEVRTRAVDLLARMSEGDTAAASFAELLDDPVPSVRAAALGGIDAKQVDLDVFVRGAADVDEEVRDVAYEALDGRLRSPSPRGIPSSVQSFLSWVSESVWRPSPETLD